MDYLPQEIIRKKRDRLPLTSAEIASFVTGVASGAIDDAQIGAFAMAVCLNGMHTGERIAFTLAMRDSGDTLRWEDLDLDGPILDKHSTGGVGDVVSLILGPVLAACGGFVPMISGRGLGHTGGTLDKLESIPGYDVTPPVKRFREVVKSAGVAIIGQTDEIAPADRRFYAVRDITATVESLDLITASILSKKLAAGLGALVMDVKVGNGAFMQEASRARELASSIVDVATGAGTPTVALLTDMNECLAPSAGNALEVHEAIRFLTNRHRSHRLNEVVFALGSELLTLGGLVADPAEAAAKIESALSSGSAAERFDRMVCGLGGPSGLLGSPGKILTPAPIVRPVLPERNGFVIAMDTRRIGLGVIGLGGGRTRADQSIDHAVGFSEIAPLGTPVNTDRPLAIVHARSEPAAARAALEIARAIKIGDCVKAGSSPILERIVPSTAITHPSRDP